MILSGKEIKNRIGKDIIINPYDEENVNPNSYNVTISDMLLIYTNEILDCKKNNPTKKIIMDNDGYILHPNRLYLANTIEYTETYNLVPKFDGRSSLGRLGLFTHVTAGMGDIGFRGKWTLELMTIHPIRIYPFMGIGQISYETVEGNTSIEYKGKYQDSQEVQSSKFYLDNSVIKNK